MSVKDTLSDMLIRIKNAQRVLKDHALIMDSVFNRRICNVLVSEGYIESFSPLLFEQKPFLKVYLKYYSGKPVISDIKRISKSSKRVYQKSKALPHNVDAFGTLVVSTPKGVMSHLEAKKRNLGGEILFWIS